MPKKNERNSISFKAYPKFPENKEKYMTIKEIVAKLNK